MQNRKPHMWSCDFFPNFNISINSLTVVGNKGVVKVTKIVNILLKIFRNHCYLQSPAKPVLSSQSVQ